jgi:hypothetical protein
MVGGGALLSRKPTTKGNGMTTQLVQGLEERVIAALKALDCTDAHAIKCHEFDADTNTLTVCGHEYLVLTNEQADLACHDHIRENLWAFNAQFLVHYMTGDIEPKMISNVQQDSCESCNELIYALVKDRFDDLVADAISCDGRGHFLAGYDHEEIEAGQYFVYRVN